MQGNIRSMSPTVFMAYWQEAVGVDPTHVLKYCIVLHGTVSNLNFFFFTFFRVNIPAVILVEPVLGKCNGRA